MIMHWIGIRTVYIVHELQIEEHGGGQGVRDAGRVEAAVAHPQTIAHYEPDADIQTLAAAYAHGIAKGHPFVDGNKRTAFAIAETFLNINGIGLIATDDDCIEQMLALAAGTLSEDEFAEWLRANTAPRK